MDELIDLLDVPVVDSNTNFWMIRSKKGFFYDEFIGNNFIAIGWNNITYSMIKDGCSEEQEKSLKEILLTEYGEKVPGAALGKCLKFCNTLKIGDIAMIVDRHRVTFARIGEYYEENPEKNSIELEKKIHNEIETAKAGMRFECPYLKRRRISVLKTFGEGEHISPYLFKAIAVNRHSLSDLSEYADTILAACFDSYIFEDKLTLTFRVNQKEDINAIALADYVSGVAKILSAGDTERVVVKTAIHSEGDIIFQLMNCVDFLKENAFSFLVLHVILFGGKVKDFELPSLMGFLKELLNRDYNKKMQELELRKKVAEVESMEADAERKQIENDKLKREQDLEIAEANFENILSAAQQLKISTRPKTVINIMEAVEKLKGHS